MTPWPKQRLRRNRFQGGRIVSRLARVSRRTIGSYGHQLRTLADRNETKFANGSENIDASARSMLESTRLGKSDRGKFRRYSPTPKTSCSTSDPVNSVINNRG